MAYVPEILCVDQQETLLDYLSRNLSSAGYEVVTCLSWAKAKEMLIEGRVQPDLILVDPVGTNGSSSSLQEVCELAGSTPVIALSTGRDPKSIVRAIQQGARGFVSKPFSLDELQKAVSDALADGKASLAHARPSPTPPVHFIANSPAMQDVQRMALRVAKSEVPVLITGETGVGKDVVARFIHMNSGLSERPFVKVNCAAMPSELVESELFGYRKGAFTGAYIDRPGKFEFANNGTIFLDEIAEFTSAVQAKLLQVLQDGQFSRLGSNEEILVNVRVLAATNQKLEAAIKQGKFREDLYYRLNVVNINISPLRRRREDIPAFCEFFMGRYTKQYESKATEIPPSLVETFATYPWPGNVRELENTIKRFAVLEDAKAIEEELREKMSNETAISIEEVAGEYVDQAVDSRDLDLKEVTRRAISRVERDMIVKTLRKTNWNKSQAARELRVSYKTLLTKIDQYGIDPSEL
ncbi:MAG: sigma-54 dependent transcriptional regulator [Acidobacteriota bacterium]